MRLFHDLQRDVRYAVAGLFRRPLFAGTAIATIGLGIGAATSVFNVINSLYLRTLPVPTADRPILYTLGRQARRLRELEETAPTARRAA